MSTQHDQTRRQFLKNIGMASAGLAMASAMPGCPKTRLTTPSSKKPNIVFIFTDDHAVQSIGAYGSKINKTPNLDRIAKEGVTLERCFCCNSICAPSRAAVLTGKHSHANGLMTNGTIFDGGQPTLPKYLKQADHWYILPGQGSYYNPDFISAEGKTRHQGYVTDVTTDMAIDWLDNKRDHIWAPGPDHLTMYDDVDIPEPDTLFDDYANRSEVLKDNEMMIAKHMMYDYDLKVTGSKVPDALGRTFKNGERARMTPEQREKWDAAYEPKNDAFRAANLTTSRIICDALLQWMTMWGVCWITSMRTAWLITPLWCIAPTRASILANTAGMTSGGCMKNLSACRLAWCDKGR